MHKLLFGAFLSGLLISFAACSEDEAKLTNSYQYFPEIQIRQKNLMMKS